MTMRGGISALVLVAAYLCIAASYSMDLKDFTYKRCDANQTESETRLVLKSVHVNPWPPKIGGSLHVEVVLDFIKKLDVGTTAQILVTYEGIQLLQESVDACRTLENINCPRGPNEKNATVAYDGTLPDIPFDGKFNVHVHGVNQDHDEIICIDFDVVLKAPQSLLQMAIQ
jgi:hypothetical protein